MNLVTLHHVGVAYDGYEALKNVDLTIAQDDFLGIIGPNGGGKTTLVKARSCSPRSCSAARSG